TRRSRFSQRDSPALRRTWGNRSCRFLVNIPGVNGNFYAIERQLSAKKYLLVRALLVTCRPNGSRRHHQLSRRGDGGEGVAAKRDELWSREELFGVSDVVA